MLPSGDELRGLLAAIVDSSDDAIVSKTLDGVITSWNRGAERLFGYTAAEAVGQHIFLIIPDDRRAEEEDVLSRIRRGEKTDHFETVRRGKDGRRIPVSLTISPVRNEDGHIIGASKVARDITERHENDMLRARLAAIVESSDDAIVSKRLDGIITSWNRGAERLFGYSEDEAVGQHIYLIIPDDRRAEEEVVLARLRRGEKIEHFETVRRTRDGRRVPISLTVSPLRDSHGNIIGASKVGRDISERVEQERLQLLTRLVLAQEEERRRIARELHDQLGQQLTALRLTLEMIKRQSVPGTELRVQVETLEQMALQLDEDVGFRVWELRPTVVQELGLQGALTTYARKWSEHFGIPVQMHMGQSGDEWFPPEIETMVYRLAQEALNNVAKHARADHVDVVLERAAEHVSLIIEDNGVGFDLSNLEAVSDGLGLIGMRERAALVGAELQIESTPGAGTTVIVRAAAVTPGVRNA